MKERKLDVKQQNPITREDIMAVLADDGYSADQRSGWLKSVLTQLTAGDDNLGDDETRLKLIDEIKTILGDQIQAPASSDDPS